MNKEKKKKKWPKVVGAILLSLVILVTIVPLFIHVDGAAGLEEPYELMSENGYMVTLPFPGTDGIDTYYLYEESKIETDKNFILIHGSMYNSYTWNEVIDYFATKGNVYAYDQIPYGLSEKMLAEDWSEDNPYTIDSAMVQLEMFMDELGIEKATLVGSSYGGVIAAEAAIRIPDRIDELIFVDAAVFVNESLPEWFVNLPQVENIGPLLARMLASSDSFYKSIYFNESVLSDERLYLNKIMINFQNWDLAYWEYLKAWAVDPSNVSSKLDQITQDSLVITGDSDSVVPVEQSEQLALELPDSSIAVIEECGHMPHEEKPNEFIQIVDDWLDD